MSKNVNVKIYKTATTKSIMDVLGALHYHKENKNQELVYKGNIVFVINEYGSSKKNEKAYVSKAGAKVAFWSIMNHTFHTLFKDGFREYGGSVANGQVRSRIFSMKLDDKKRFVFQIDEGAGKREANGSIKMAKVEKTVQSYVSYEEAQKMAHEVYSYISQEEMIAMMNGKPLYTILPVRSATGTEQQETQQQDSNYEQMETYGEPTFEESPVETVPKPPENSYIIQLGNWNGTAISQLTSVVLESIVAKLEPDTPEKQELWEEAKKELGRR